jgi:hypothetical protein
MTDDSINFDGIQLVSSQVDAALNEHDRLNRGLHQARVEAVARRHGIDTVGWDYAFAELEADDAKETAFARSLGFDSASEFHKMTAYFDKYDQHPDDLEVEWEDLRP